MNWIIVVKHLNGVWLTQIIKVLIQMISGIIEIKLKKNNVNNNNEKEEEEDE